ncbi:cell envelope integrity protein TolA [Dyella tabacisoli]|uniref:Cell envelope integrity protein TolA n=1 Tax=Dyella tabacisoli TaxID=2282381 RepID=A0A369UIW7_9GAMM|nr:cell envelope integrity protein TolA [Dyella tabacisoli]RDD80491.1 cell envelope integrity protein TolA [Dyella tabacisoli]
MDDRKGTEGTPKAVVLAAVLHLGIVGFLALAIVPCSSYEKMFETLHLPASWNPIACAKPLELPGEIIEATLIGPTGSPPPKPVKTKPVPDSTPPPPAVPPPTPPQEETPKIKTLPPPPEHPDIKEQERVAEEGLQKAADAKREQEEKQRQRQSEIDAQAAKKKEEDKKKLDELFAKMDAASAQTKKLDNKAKQAKQQIDDLKNAADNGQADLPPAEQRQSGTNGKDSLQARYLAAIQNAVTQNWLRPDNMPSTPCVVHIVQLVGGDVMSAKVDPGCPYDEAGKRSIENAVLRAQPLPYKGFESVFNRNIDFTFRPQ